ncbi:PPE family protein PPE29 [Mycobacterium tuberculosis H37Rv] [Mycobacterium shimoidei]|uniref:PPE family protein PPE29 [Mycobacterium tuberculosis H37Rv] n=1 Tax=Mycobacterium shimoidei TaxID=29313 RepID=A0A375Z3I4_MYCSH|nr:PPE domain-containing protein [Mycobacterium shimoidei]SRX95723.1 PPE family protein PPE29 [Mycobacterium tuberculosis H37Rv] [Mycobacterium shimoidei]
MEFAMLPPEVNSGLMYVGPGSGPMLAAAAAWDGLAAELNSAAASYESVITRLSEGWLGPASTAMAAAAAPHAEWMHTAAAQAEQTATQAKAAVAAYEAAFAMTVPPPVIAANRAQLASLVATNFFGQNTAAIAATEAQYGEMWAQDAAAMYSYAGNSAAASALAPFNPPDQGADPAGLAAQAAAVGQATGASATQNTSTAMSQLTSGLPTALEGATSLTSSSSAVPTAAVTSLPAAPAQAIDPSLALGLAGLGFSAFGALAVDGLGTFGIDTAGSFGVDVAGIGVALQAAQIETGGVYPGFEVFPGWGTSVSAGLGEASTVGRLSVPPGWAAAAPAFHTAAVTTPITGAGAAAEGLAASSGTTFSEMALAGMAGRALAGTVGGRRRDQPGTPMRQRAGAPERSPSGPITSISAELRELADLRDAGILTDDEFTEQKRRLLGQ